MSLFAPYEPRDAGSPRPPLPAELVVREAMIRDAPAVARLIAEREGDAFEQRLEKISAELARDEVGRQRMLVVAEVGGAVVGFGRIVYCLPSPDAPHNAAPAGWYLGGVVVAPAHRRCGVARALTRRRIEWLRERGVAEAWFVVNADNRASIDLHAAFGFREVTRDFVQPGVTFSGRGQGILFRVALA